MRFSESGVEHASSKSAGALAPFIRRRPHVYTALLDRRGFQCGRPGLGSATCAPPALSRAAACGVVGLHGPLLGRSCRRRPHRRPQLVPLASLRSAMATNGGDIPDDRRWIELARVIDNLIGQVQALVDTGGHEAERMTGLEQATRQIQGAVADSCGL